MTELRLTEHERALLGGEGGEGLRTAMRIVTETARVLGATALVPIESAHADGGVYLGDASVAFLERLVEDGARVAVPTTTNVGSVDLGRSGTPNLVRLDDHRTVMARRQMQAYEALGCTPTWTCAPYQAGHRPRQGAQVAWGESNAVVFCNSVLGARTNRYGDFLDIACALVGRAPLCGLHTEPGRRARVRVETNTIPDALKARDDLWPVLGAWLGQHHGQTVAVFDGLQGFASEDRLKSLGAAAAAYGATGLFHVAGVTPEAPDADTALHGEAPKQVARVDMSALRKMRAMLDEGDDAEPTAVAVGSPHLSLEEFEQLIALLDGRAVHLPFFAHTGRHVVEALRERGALDAVHASGVSIVADTCIAVTPILAAEGGVLLTNSAKFACYAMGTTGHAPVYGSLRDCVETAVAGHRVRDADGAWAAA